MNALSSRSIKLNSKLYLTELTLPAGSSDTKIRKSINHVFCCDVSGSMYSSLNKMRTQLKNRIPEIVSEDDTVTIIVFSGRNECTTLKEFVKVNNAQSLMELNKAIDKYMHTIGMTCFLDPVEYTNELISRKPSEEFNWIFLSDGGNNDAPWSSVIDELTKLAPNTVSCTIIEYGYYADTAKLNEMTEIMGGTKILAEDFDSYVPVIESALKANAELRKSVDVESVKSSMRYTQFMYIKNNNVYLVIANGKTSIEIPESVDKLYYLANKKVGEELTDYESLLYAMAYANASYLRYNVVEDILGFTKDEKFLDMFSTAYGKQKLFQFQTEILKAAFDESYRGKINPDYKPNVNKYSLVNLMEDLYADEDNQVMVASDRFVYNRIGAKSVNKIVLGDDQVEALKSARTKKDVDKIQKELAENSVKMTMVDKGYPINNFVWNEERANLNAQFMIDVNLELPKNKFGIDSVDSFVFRNYNLIKDGVLNVAFLPVKLTGFTRSTLMKKCPDALSEVSKDGVTMIDLTKLPLVNKNQSCKVKIHEMTENLLNLTSLKFKLKYLGYLKKKFNLSDGNQMPAMAAYSSEALTWLASLGITEKGYQPKTELDKSEDFYMALTFKSDFKSFSSVPKVEDVLKKLNDGKKLTPSENFMHHIMLEVDSTYLDGIKGNEYLKAIRSAFNQLSIEKKNLQQFIGSVKFGMILSRKWFSDCEDMSTDTDTITNQYGDEMTIIYRFTETKQSL
jgi:hypothetical protein